MTPNSGKPPHVAWMWQLAIARADGEIAWCERIAELVESGESYLPEGVDGDGWERFIADVE